MGQFVTGITVMATDVDGEIQAMTSNAFTYGSFRFLALGDLGWEKEMELSCPVNNLGTVTIYRTSPHGLFDGTFTITNARNAFSKTYKTR